MSPDLCPAEEVAFKLQTADFFFFPEPRVVPCPTAWGGSSSSHWVANLKSRCELATSR